MVIGAMAAALSLPLFLLAIGGSLGSQAACPDRSSTSPEPGALTQLDPEQLRVAEQVVVAVRAFSATSESPHAAVVALATARQESGLRNLHYGGRDSLGVFQQRPSQGWGTPEHILDVSKATTSFLKHLIQVPDWQTLPVTQAAAAVQRPADEFRESYQRWVPMATDLTATLWPASPGAGALCLAGHSFTGGVVTNPVPAGLAGNDLRNWGGQGDHWASWHTGTDFSVACGTPVLASTEGTVEIQAGPDWYGRWLVKIVTGPDSLATWYAHMGRVTVMDGDMVGAGDQIGEVGDLGNTTGCHLHFEVHLRNGPIYGADNTDPTGWLARHVGRPLILGGDGGSTSTKELNARVATFNVLGASHTAPGGNSSNHLDAATRMKWTVQALAEHRIDIVGMQEFEPVQESTFMDLTTGSWDHLPESHGRPGSANVVAWRTDRWMSVAAARLPIPYFHGHPVQMPYVLLENPAGQRVWVISVHNPADTRGPAQQWRDAAVRAEADLVAQLSADGTPVVLTGDMNERARFFCAITAAVAVHAANGGEADPRCRPPVPMGIDWIVGTADVTFSNYQSTRQALIGRASDHPLVSTDIAFD